MPTQKFYLDRCKILAGIGIALVLAGCGQTSAPPPTDLSSSPVTSPAIEISSKPDKNGFLIYTNKTLGIQIKFPVDWNIKNMAGSSVPFFFSPESSSADPANLNIIITSLQDPAMTLEDYTVASIKDMKTRFTPFKLLVSKSVKLSTLSAYQVIYTGTYEGQNFKSLQIWAIENGRTYLLSFGGSEVAYDKFVKTAQQMIETFKFL